MTDKADKTSRWFQVLLVIGIPLLSLAAAYGASTWQLRDIQRNGSEPTRILQQKVVVLENQMSELQKANNEAHREIKEGVDKLVDFHMIKRNP